MAKKVAKATPAATPVAATPVKEATGSRFSRAVAKGKDFGKNIADKARAAGVSAQAAGKKAAAHVSRNRAAYIAGGLGAAGVAAGATGIAAASRKKRADGDS